MRVLALLLLVGCSGAGFAPADLIGPPDPDAASAVDTGKLGEPEPDTSDAGTAADTARDSADPADTSPAKDSATTKDSASPEDTSTVEDSGSLVDSGPPPVDSSLPDACSVPTLAANQLICAPGQTWISTCLGAGCTWWAGQVECCPNGGTP
jgi:hypothetical protein